MQGARFGWKPLKVQISKQITKIKIRETEARQFLPPFFFRQIDTVVDKNKGKRQKFFRQIAAGTNWRLILDKEKVRNPRTEVIKLETHYIFNPNHFGRIQIILYGYKSFWRVQIILDGSNSSWMGSNHFEPVQLIKISQEKSKLDLFETNRTRPKWFRRSKIIFD